MSKKPRSPLKKLLVDGGWTGEDRVDILAGVMSYDKDFVLDWWQEWYIKHKDKFAFLAANKSRRVGWSFITAGDGLVRALDPQMRRYTKQFVSYTLDDAKEKIKSAREFYESIPSTLRTKKLVRNSQTYLEFLDVDKMTTSRLVSWPCKGPRGKGGDISLDEMAIYGIKAEEVYTAALGVIARGGNVEIGSTPLGNSGRFYEVLTDNLRYKHYKRMEIPWWYSSALCKSVELALDNQSLAMTELVYEFGTDKMIEIFESMPYEDFLQEYALSFRDELSSYITLDMIQACTPVGVENDDQADWGDEIPLDSVREIKVAHSIDELKLMYHPDIHGTLYAGFDVGRTQDASELIVMCRKPGETRKRMIALISYRKMPFDEQEKQLLKLMNQLPIHRLCIDKTGLGMHLAENMEKKKGEEWKGLPSRTKSKKIWLRLSISRSKEKNTFCRPTETYSNRFIRSNEHKPALVMHGLILSETISTMPICSGVSRSVNMELVQPRHARASSMKSFEKRNWPQQQGA